MTLRKPYCHLETGPTKVPVTHNQKLMKGQRKAKVNMSKYVQDKKDFRGRTPKLIYNVIFFFNSSGSFAYYLIGPYFIQTTI
jgi:hypothetical protein